MTAAPPPTDWQMAQACRQRGDGAGEIAALQNILRADPRDLAAMLAMGQAKARAGDDRAATSWFTAALNQAALVPPPARIGPLLGAARDYVAQARIGFGERLTAGLSAAGIDPERCSPAVRHAIDLLHGRSEVYLQQPSMFYYPGLPQRPFYARSDFDWADGLEAATADIRAELRALAADGGAFGPYVERPADRPAPNNPLLDDARWSAAYLWRGGEVVAGRQDSCPATLAALARLPQPVIAGRSPIALFSRLTPGTHIQPHHGLLNTRLICHLPLIVPDGCGLRVGHETRAWREGALTIFDDSFEHEAWNRGTSDRIVLLFEIWRPEIGEEDRATLTALFETIDRVDPHAQQEQDG